MPKYIADNHHHFVEEFMTTGKTRFLKRKRELFMKQKSGYILPVVTYLSINNLSRRHMILIFEENPGFHLFDQHQENNSSNAINGVGQSAYIMTNKKFNVGEISSNFA